MDTDPAHQIFRDLRSTTSKYAIFQRRTVEPWRSPSATWSCQVHYIHALSHDPGSGAEWRGPTTATSSASGPPPVLQIKGSQALRMSPSGGLSCCVLLRAEQGARSGTKGLRKVDKIRNDTQEPLVESISSSVSGHDGDSAVAWQEPSAREEAQAGERCVSRSRPRRSLTATSG